MLKLLLLTFLASGRDTIITDLAPQTPARITIRILSTSPTPLHNILLEWSLQTNGFITRNGKTIIPTLRPRHPAFAALPVRQPDDTAGESFLLLSYHFATASSPPTSSPLRVEQQLGLTPWRPTLSIPAAGEITLTDENDISTIHSPTIRISFNRQTGWLVHYEIKGIDLIDDALGLKPNFRCPRYNDSATIPEPHLQLFSNTTSPEQIIIRTEYTLPAIAALLHLSYTINAGGEMLVTQQVEPDTTQPTKGQFPPPCFGMQWVLPPGFDSITGYGMLDSTRIGIFHDRPTIPSEPGPKVHTTSTRTNIRWWTITDKEGNGLQFIADTLLLNASAQPIHPFHPLPIHINIDRAALPNPEHPAFIGNLRYAYKVKPLFTSRISNHH